MALPSLGEPVHDEEIDAGHHSLKFRVQIHGRIPQRPETHRDHLKLNLLGDYTNNIIRLCEFSVNSVSLWLKFVNHMHTNHSMNPD